MSHTLFSYCRQHPELQSLEVRAALHILPLLPCLQDEMEELRSEMLEMRDMYMEDDVYQLQDLRQQLEQVRPGCGGAPIEAVL